MKFLATLNTPVGRILLWMRTGALYWGGHLRYHRFLAFLTVFAGLPCFGKNGDFLAAQPPKRPFDRPVRLYLRCLRARGVQSATLPLIYVRCGDSNLPARPKKRPRVPAGPLQNGQFPAPGARSLAVGIFFRHMGISPTIAFRVDKNPAQRGLRPTKTADL